VTSATPHSLGGLVLDASALAELGAGPNIYATTFVDVAAGRGITMLVPAAALSEAWQIIRSAGPGHADQMTDFLAGPMLVFEPLDVDTARRAGELVEGRGVQPDVSAAQVATACRQRGWAALSTSPERLLAVDPTIAVAKLPGA
jgi:hypothetical protein